MKFWIPIPATLRTPRPGRRAGQGSPPQVPHRKRSQDRVTAKLASRAPFPAPLAPESCLLVANRRRGKRKLSPHRNKISIHSPRLFSRRMTVFVVRLRNV
jgi:hypothetical protein